MTFAVPMAEIQSSTSDSQDAKNPHRTERGPKPPLETTISGDKEDQENGPCGQCPKHPADRQLGEEAPNPEDGRIESLRLHS